MELFQGESLLYWEVDYVESSTKSTHKRSSIVIIADSAWRYPIACGLGNQGPFQHCSPFILTKAPSALHETDFFGERPIHRACGSPDAATVDVLLKLNPCAYYLSRYPLFSKSPFAKAIQHENIPVLKYLAEINAWGNAVPLHFACKNGSHASIRLLLDKYPHAARDVDKHGRTPLALYAANNDADTEIIELLVDAHQEAMQMLDCDGVPPLSQAQKDALITHLFQHRTPGKRARLE